MPLEGVEKGVLEANLSEQHLFFCVAMIIRAAGDQQPVLLCQRQIVFRLLRCVVRVVHLQALKSSLQEVRQVLLHSAHARMSQ